MKQKDKAKAYDEVLTKAVALYNASEPMSGCNVILETLFPELKEDEQKPAWSDEDERLCQCLIEDQEEALDKVRKDMYGHSEIISDLMEMYHEIIDWLKSIKDRVQPQNTEKEVNLEKEFDKCCENYTFDDECEVYTAKHFFKLGFELQKGE